jgi:hypothetical protein
LKAEHNDDSVFCLCVAAFMAVDGKTMPDRVRAGLDASQRKPEKQPFTYPQFS